MNRKQAILENAIKNRDFSKLNSMSAEAIIKLVVDTYGDGAYIMSSFGAESAVMLRLAEKAKVNIKVIHIDTGFLFKETLDFRSSLKSLFSLDIVSVGPKKSDVSKILKDKLWEKDVKKYNQMVKVDPLNKAIKDLDIKVIISGIRGDQTDTRASKNIVEKGPAGELRVYPIINWSPKDVGRFMATEDLPYHPLYLDGYKSIGDWTTTSKGNTRQESRSLMGEKLECGIHIVNG